MTEYPVKVAVEELSQAPQYGVILKKIADLAPIVPAYTYKGDSNIEEIKFKLAQREMHSLVMNILNPKGKAE